MKIKLLFIFALILGSLYPQTNIEVFHKLMDSSWICLNNKQDVKSSVYYFSQNNDYNYFDNFILSNKNKNIDSSKNLVLKIEKASVTYGDLFRTSLLGEYNLNRNVFLSGYYLYKNKNIETSYPFNEQYSDTVNYNDIQNIESDQYLFTKGKKPDNFNYSSLTEPVIAVSISALTVILFFVLRSK